MHAEEGGGDGFVTVEILLDDSTNDGLSSGAGFGVEADLEFGKCKGKEEEEDESGGIQ